MNRNPDRQMSLYFATVLPGLETLLAEELTAKVDGTSISEMARAKVFFTSEASLDRMKQLRMADNLYRVISRFTVGRTREDLNRLEEQVSRLELRPFLRPGTFQVNASRTGRHAYSRFDAARAAMNGVLRRYPRLAVSTGRPADTEFRLDLAERAAVFSLKLTDPAFRFRQARRSFSAAALLPTVAHAMVWLSKPDASDIFLDPCCGSGTILQERLCYPFTYAGGGDSSPEAVQTARTNLSGSYAEVMHWDARSLPVSDGSISKVVTNLPFGRQIKTADSILDVNRAILRESARILAPGGLAVLLSEGWDRIVAEAESCGLRLQAAYPLSLKGLHPVLYVFQAESTGIHDNSGDRPEPPV